MVNAARTQDRQAPKRETIKIGLQPKQTESRQRLKPALNSSTWQISCICVFLLPSSRSRVCGHRTWHPVIPSRPDSLRWCHRWPASDHRDTCARAWWRAACDQFPACQRLRESRKSHMGHIYQTRTYLRKMFMGSRMPMRVRFSRTSYALYWTGNLRSMSSASW